MEERTTTQDDCEKGAFLSLRNLQKVYPNGEKAVYNFNLDIDKNEFIVIVGPSGCGKSTTLRMLAGLEDITSGDIFMEGELINYKPCKDRRMAIVFQSYALYPQMNVYQNIAFPLTINKYPMPVINRTLVADRQIKDILNKVPYNKYVGVLYNVFSESGKTDSKIEDIANVFGILPEAAKILHQFFAAYRGKSLEELDAMEESFRSALLEKLETIAGAERKRVAEKGIRMDASFRLLDEDGSVLMENRNYTPYEIKTRVYETAEKLDLTPYLDKLPKELSGGQMQRVALGRAIVKNVPVFLMDEPLSNLDAKLRLTMRSEIVKLHNRINATTVYVTHDQTEAMTMATRIVVMSKGFVQQIGTPEEIYNRPRNLFVARFIGSPAMNIFEMKLDHAAKCLRAGDLHLPLDENVIAQTDTFYERKAQELSQMCEHFDEAEADSIRKLLSVTGEHIEQRKKQKSFFARFRRKKGDDEEKWAEERKVCENKLEAIRGRDRDENLLVGIRPERLKLEVYDPKKKYEGGFVVKPTVCELLGGEYSVHFDYCGKDMVGQISAEQLVTTNDMIHVCFSTKDIYIFDPITGETLL
ncbi:MAG TPA: ABC transporter ATP-binding protein [Firmicutes bacterium]|nr:ABC transporter ATP-binding protein [Bacillota bacterium]